MVIEVDLSSVPPALALADADDMSTFSVRVSRPEHTFIGRDELLELAGDHAADSSWRARLEAMLDYAATKGWIRDEDGAVRAHLEWQP